jgi:hypothetical protein
MYFWWMVFATATENLLHSPCIKICQLSDAVEFQPIPLSRLEGKRILLGTATFSTF